MSFSAQLILRSTSNSAPSLDTYVLRYPRIIHSEFMTHRVFSRNASSSRAIPTDRVLAEALRDVGAPFKWGKNQKGMQAREECNNPVIINGIEYTPLEAWKIARDWNVMLAQAFADAGHHKQTVNRIMEPYSHISVIVTATDWDNFFQLRLHEDADPTFQELARHMAEARYSPLVTQHLEAGRWHLPFINQEVLLPALRERRVAEEAIPYVLARISAARCARVSYLNHDGSSPDFLKDLELSDKLSESRHMSPFEHQARVPDPSDMDTSRWRNFRGWEQYRHYEENNRSWGWEGWE